MNSSNASALLLKLDTSVDRLPVLVSIESTLLSNVEISPFNVEISPSKLPVLVSKESNLFLCSPNFVFCDPLTTSKESTLPSNVEISPLKLPDLVSKESILPLKFCLSVSLDEV